jgi:hypothetical protein
VTKRVLALMVALAVVSSPVALQVCQITCESRATQPLRSDGAAGHAAQHHMPAGHAACPEHAETQSQLPPVEGPCDHGAETTPNLVAARNFDHAVSLVATLPTIDPISFISTHVSLCARQPTWLDRLEIPLAIPLRL